MRVGFQLRFPELAPALCLESPQSTVICAADEDQAARSDNRAAYIDRPGLGNTGPLQLLVDPERDLPDNVARVQVDGTQGAPGGRLTRAALCVPETPTARGRVSQLVRIGEQVAATGIERRPGPVAAADGRRVSQRLLGPGRSVDRPVRERIVEFGRKLMSLG